MVSSRKAREPRERVVVRMIVVRSWCAIVLILCLWILAKAEW